jgi:hypothetical protein
MSNTDHIDDLKADKSHKSGCVTKCVGSKFKNHHGSYRKNGYNEHKNDAGKKARYQPIDKRIAKYGRPEPEQQLGAKKKVMRTPRLPRGPKTSWDFVGKNFKNANKPFVHMYHHMVPWEVMSETFKLPELKLFQVSEYNINEGINLIILPCYPQIGIIIGMYTHPNDHPKYTLDLITTLTRIKNQLKGDEQKHLKKDEVAFLKTVLETWERSEWWEIAVGGMKAMGDHVNEYQPSSTMADLWALLVR